MTHTTTTTTTTTTTMYNVIYDTSFMDSLWIVDMEGNMGEEAEAGLFTLHQAKTLALHLVNLDPAVDAEARVLEAEDKDFVCDGSSLLYPLIDREVCYNSVHEYCDTEAASAYEQVFTYAELLDLNKAVDKNHALHEAYVEGGL